jgi:hypothetical protein
MVTSLLCHDEIKVCRVCVGWLNMRVGGIDVTPTLVGTVAVPRRVQPLLRRAVEFVCADCGCLVDRGVIVTPCEAYPNCCCVELSVRDSGPATDENDPPKRAR